MEEQTEVEEQREEQEVEEQQRMQEALGGAPQVTVRRHRPGGDLTLMLRIALGGVNLRVQDGEDPRTHTSGGLNDLFP